MLRENLVSFSSFSKSVIVIMSSNRKISSHLPTCPLVRDYSTCGKNWRVISCNLIGMRRFQRQKPRRRSSPHSKTVIPLFGNDTSKHACPACIFTRTVGHESKGRHSWDCGVPATHAEHRQNPLPPWPPIHR